MRVLLSHFIETWFKKDSSSHFRISFVFWQAANILVQKFLGISNLAKPRSMSWLSVSNNQIFSRGDWKRHKYVEIGGRVSFISPKKTTTLSLCSSMGKVYMMTTMKLKDFCIASEDGLTLFDFENFPYRRETSRTWEAWPKSKILLLMSLGSRVSLLLQGINRAL